MPPIRIVTFNVRFDSAEDGAHDWPHRRADVREIIRAHDPDLVSVQEPDASQWADLCADLPGYTPFGVFDEGTDTIEPKGGFFRASRFEGREQGVFWLSDTPAIPHSVSWANDWEPRACGWARLRDRRANRELLFAATHFDTNAGAGLPSAHTLHRELERIARGSPIVVSGDFNCAAGSPAHTYLLTEGGFRDVWYEAGRSDAGVLTFHGFTGQRHLPNDPAGRDRWLRAICGVAESPSSESASVHAPANYRIDWILWRGALTCREATIDVSSASGQPASDHYPVIASLDWA